MAVTPRHGSRSQPPPAPSGLRFGEMVRLGALGLASDIRDRSRDPALRKRPSAHALDPRLHRPSFIIGAPRSGTTFLGSCLGRMPEVSYHFEPRLTKAAARCVYDGSWSERRCATVFRISYAALLRSRMSEARPSAPSRTISPKRRPDGAGGGWLLLPWRGVTAIVCDLVCVLTGQ